MQKGKAAPSQLNKRLDICYFTNLKKNKHMGLSIHSEVIIANARARAHTPNDILNYRFQEVICYILLQYGHRHPSKYKTK